jgi:hypothetical protein
MKIKTISFEELIEQFPKLIEIYGNKLIKDIDYNRFLNDITE